jgi:hypothetical protein
MNEPMLAATVMGLLILTSGTAVVLRGPIGKALAQWIASWSSPEHKAMEAKWAEVAAGSPAGMGELQAEVAELRRELEGLRQSDEQLAELGERVDFLERLLARQREAERLVPPSGR